MLMDVRAVLVRKYGVTSRDNLVNKDDDGGEEKLENISSTATGGPKDFFKFRSDSVASCDIGIGDCDLEVDPETGLEVISLDEVSYHCTMEDGWMVIYDKVYDVTEYLERGSHPGGEDVMMEYLGYDATMAFRGVGHSKGALRILEKYVVGILPVDERLNFRPDF
eukprot:TRINITY_DN17712_c0_g1_i1.p1 TRINITY_DN17712_c0_g1~~TRINITY_DN17712_c0_g1_i1.p1  ORF type:complete len:165 (-),score=59.03 TRINITY_DN17712_c0_g1_i1:84-578(-)